MKGDPHGSLGEAKSIVGELKKLHDQKSKKKENDIDVFGTAENLEAMEVQVGYLQSKLGFKAYDHGKKSRL